MNVDRSVSSYEDYYLIFCLAGLIENADETTRVATTRITATMHESVIGISEWKWYPDNNMWTVLNGDAIFEWPQAIELEPKTDGLIQFSIDVKLTTFQQWITLDGHAYARVRNIGVDEKQEAKFRSSWKYNLLQCLPKRIRRKL